MSVHSFRIVILPVSEMLVCFNCCCCCPLPTARSTGIVSRTSATHYMHPYVSRVLMVLLIWIACVQLCVPKLLLNQTPAAAVPGPTAVQDCLGTQFALLVESATQLAVSTDFLGLLFAVVGRFCARFLDCQFCCVFSLSRF